uniref:Transmembrane 9 superfamily member n=1 Tax=Rhizophora mucronata TaxID=61149 RepID=A0A2P2M9M8_RHIMU
MNKNCKLQMVKHIISIPNLNSNRVPSPPQKVTFLLGIPYCRQIIKNQIHLIHLINSLFQQLKTISRQWLRLTQKDLTLIGVHLKPIG